MKKTLIGALAGLTAAGALAAALPAEARDWDHHHHDGGAAVAAGIAGLAIGAAIAGSHDGYYDSGYYAQPQPAYYYGAPAAGYYAGPAYYSSYHRCHIQWRWDPYWGRYVQVRACY
jgi:hypothetical protein